MSIHMPTRGGTRGGQDQFEWEDVKVDKDRENYLGEIGAFPLKDFTSDRSRQFFSPLVLRPRLVVFTVMCRA